MQRRLVSMGVKFPLLMTSIVLGTSIVFVWSAYREYSGVLYRTSGQRLEYNAGLLVSLLRESTPAGGGQLARTAQHGELRRLLTTQGIPAVAESALVAAFPQLSDSTRLRAQLLDARGKAVLQYTLGDIGALDAWAVAAAERGELSATAPSLSPVFNHEGMPYYELAVPVHARDDGESHVGFLVETRMVRGRNVDAVQRLIGTKTILIGQPGAGVWTDLTGVAPPPPPFERMDSAFVFDDSPRGPGIGVAQMIPGTPWAVWLQFTRQEVLTPARSFVWQMAPVVILVAILGALFAWLFSRRITRRITALTEELDRIEVGPEGNGIGAAAGRDEIDRLEAALRSMSERAEKQHAIEAQMMQSQKLEAVGRLAGGIAHDFNNMLTVVANYGEMIQGELPPGSPAARDMEEVLHATQGAANLTRQLLAFSRRQIIQPVRVDLNEVIRGSHRMLQRLIPSNVACALDLDAAIGAVNADPGQLEQVLMNLALNAVDAMPSGGRLTIRTLLAELDPAEQEDPGGLAPSKRHVCLVLTDTGVGMDRETAERVFEPFFTTKPIGKGTGLGLASVHGIVTQLGGRIWVYSEPGHGTTFKIYFPELQGAAEPLQERAAFKPFPPGQGTILLVEDDPATREVTRRLLTRHGYQVVLAVHGAEALDLLARGDHQVQLVLSDVMMPEMGGIQLAGHIADRWPTLPVLLMSGYSDADLRAKDTHTWTFRLIEKPFTSATLLAATTLALSGGPSAD